MVDTARLSMYDLCMKKKKIRMTVDLTPEFHERLSRLEELCESGTTSNLMRQALQVYEFLVEKTLAGYSFQAVKGEESETLVFSGPAAASIAARDKMGHEVRNMGEQTALDAPVGNIPDVETLERISTLLEGSIVMTDAICIENHRAGFPLRTLRTGEQCGWGRKRGCHCGDGFVEPDEAEIENSPTDGSL